MRWQALFDDIDAQLTAATTAEHAAEVADRTRREGAAIRTVDRLRAALGQPLVVRVLGAGSTRGAVLDVGPDWLLLQDRSGREVLVVLAAVLDVQGLGRDVAVPGSEGEVAARLGLGWAVRGLARARASVRAHLVDGTVLTGTVDRGGVDHLEMALHPAGEPRRQGVVREVRLVPFSALALLQPGV